MNPVAMLGLASTAIELADAIKRIVAAMHDRGDITDEQMAETFAKSKLVDALWDDRVSAAKARLAEGDGG